MITGNNVSVVDNPHDNEHPGTSADVEAPHWYGTEGVRSMFSGKYINGTYSITQERKPCHAVFQQLKLFSWEHLLESWTMYARNIISLCGGCIVVGRWCTCESGEIIQINSNTQQTTIKANKYTRLVGKSIYTTNGLIYRATTLQVNKR